MRGLVCRRLVRSTRVPHLLAKYAGVDLKIPRSRGEQLTDHIAAGNVRGHGQELLDVLIQVLSTAVGDGIGNMGNRSGHEWQNSGFAMVTSLFLELSQQGDLEVIKVMVIS